MATILISWLGVEKDFKQNSIDVNVEGPTWNFYKYHYKKLKIKYHLLLITPNFLPKAKNFSNKAQKQFGYEIKIMPVDVQHVHADLQGIKSKVEKILLEHSSDDIYIFFSTGSAIMKLAWFLLHISLGLNTHLIQILKPEPNKKEPELIFLNFEKSPIPYSLIIKEIYGKTYESEIIITNKLKDVYHKAALIAQTDSVSVLILGETGTGKEQLARFIHKNSARRNNAFKAINCAAFSDQLLESRLFGYAKGSFTGAHKDTKGILELADKGTVFLDEIGDISPYMQQALLRFLQDKEIQPIGKQPKKVDVRIIAATNKDILTLLKKNHFRSDLFYRFSAILELPPFYSYPLEEKQKIISHLLEQRAKIFKRDTIKLCSELKNFLISYRMPGNFRELQNIIDHFYIFAEDKACMEHLPYHVKKKPNTYTKLDDVIKEHIQKIYYQFNKNKSKTAEALGISLNTLKSKLKKYKIE